MHDRWHDRLLWRESGYGSRQANLKNLYGDRNWIDDLDIINELGGHSGCVNALCWSSSGRLLASGSDDQHLNIHTYQPELALQPFSLNTTVSTGHSANIFSVKFMPHSNDRTLVTAAGDAEVRVFDIEYSGAHSVASDSASTAASARGQRFRNMYRGVNYLSDGNTNARVYRSHGDRVKRIVTESSPNLFLTCSEDGEVRQFDLRLPSSAYPVPRGGRGFSAHRSNHSDDNVPPPLISYKRFNLDLNSISCSASQPHYIALGGAHLHCFLHDRRMVGRDIDLERGNPDRASSVGSASSGDVEAMSQATQCVRKFAPLGRKTMRRTDHGHITACKISDANPNEMIVSWSGDHIYSFDLLRSPDAGPSTKTSSGSFRRGMNDRRTRDSQGRRGKIPKDGTIAPKDIGAGIDIPVKGRRRRSSAAIRLHYESGRTEDVNMMDTEDAHATNPETLMSHEQRRSRRIAHSIVRIRKMIFSREMDNVNLEHGVRAGSDSEFTCFRSAVSTAVDILPEMKSIASSWAYPVVPGPDMVLFQRTLRCNRSASVHFVQAAGTLARLIYSQLKAEHEAVLAESQHFQHIQPIQPDGFPLADRQAFCFMFLTIITAWLDGGLAAVVTAFTKPKGKSGTSPCFILPDDANEGAVFDVLVPHLIRLASDKSVPNIDVSRFEHDQTRHIFKTQKAAMIALGNAIRIPFADQAIPLPTADVASEQNTGQRPLNQNRLTAVKFWGLKVGRSVLLSAGEGVTFQFVDTAFGGLGLAPEQDEKSHEDIDMHESEEVIHHLTLQQPKGDSNALNANRADVPENDATAGQDDDDLEHEDAISDAEVILIDDLQDEIAEHLAAHDNALTDDDDGSDHNDDDDEDDDNDKDMDAEMDDSGDMDEDDDDADDITAEERSFMFKSASQRGKLRERVQKDVPCSGHTRTYRGHCNVKTVKDANFFGLRDEYVVSGSDDGNLFIWDKQTSELLNILEGDGEVVNVVQGHPYEPILAVSGIDRTIKIFSPDLRAQEDAKNGVNISSAVNGDSWLGRGQHRRWRDQDDGLGPSEGLASRKRMAQSYSIVGQNDVQRKGGMQDAYITRGMLAQLAARLRSRRAGGPGAGEEGGGHVVMGEDGQTILMDDNCSTM